MAQKTDFRSILADIKKKNFAPIYILMGEETYYIDAIEEALAASVVGEDEKDFNMAVYYGQDADINVVIGSCQQYPFMSDRRLVMLKEAQSYPHNAKSALEKFAEYAAHPNDTNVLVISYKGDNLNATSKLLKNAAAAEGVIFKSPKLKDWQMAGPIKEYCASKRVGISERAVALLVEYLGSSLSKVFGEIDKLIVASGSGLTQITPELIEKNIGISKDFNNFELQTALATKNYDKALQIIKYFESNPKQNPTIVTTGTLYSFYSKLVAGFFTSDHSDKGLMAAMGLKSTYPLKDYKAAMTKYTAMQAIGAIHLLRDFDRRSKGIGSFQKEYPLLRELIFNIFTRKD